MRDDEEAHGPPSNLRIACLEPSASAICARLGLIPYIVGVTHECDVKHFNPKIARILTKNGLTVTSQGDIHLAVQAQEAARKAAAAAATIACPLLPSQQSSSDSNSNNNSKYPTSLLSQSVNSLYPLLDDQLEAAQPNVIFTQNLCSVCAPTEQDVWEILLRHNNNNDDGDEDNTKEKKKKDLNHTIRVISLQPTTLEEVAETYVTIAEVCGIRNKGQALKDQWLKDLNRIQTTILSVTHRLDSTTVLPPPPPSIVVLEWLDPPFDGGHWILQMIQYAGLTNAMEEKKKMKKSHKSLAMTWEDISEVDPDVILVGCCGFELERNIQDVYEQRHRFQNLRATREDRIFACDGNSYIVQPGPDLLQGTLITAKCAYSNQPEVMDALNALNLFSSHDETKAWQKINILLEDDDKESTIDPSDKRKQQQQQQRANLFQPITSSSDDPTSKSKSTVVVAVPSDPSVMDIEDLVVVQPNGYESGGGGFSKVHQEACEQGLKTYMDPETGYQVFTALAHKERGWCCGSGCRHCPYSHQNVKDKANKIQQPSILYHATTGQFLSMKSTMDTDSSSSSLKQQGLKVLFFSGGKDSFLTIRAMVRQSINATTTSTTGQDVMTFALILLTTFDATTRKIAHQEIPIDDVIRQAQHLDLTLLGIPLRRGSGETYFERIRLGLDVIETTFGQRVDTLVFGDLHLNHIKEWRDKTFVDCPLQLEYPLWKVDYGRLMDDLEASQVPCIISGSSVESIPVGTPFTRELYDKCQREEEGLDGFGEQGEFHSLAKVWEVSRETALGL